MSAFRNPDDLTRVGRIVEPERPKTPFEIIDLDDIELSAEPAWLIDKLLPAQGIAVVYGLPKSGKSFLTADAVFHIALGRAWTGCDVLQGSVAYCCGEGLSGFKRRMAALRERHSVTGKRVPFGLIPMAPNLGSASGDDQKIVEALRTWLGDSKPPLRVIVIDTLARAMPGVDENSAKDIGTLIDNCERIARAFGCLVILIHHAGKDAERGPRGSIALPGAIDCMWKVEKGEAGNLATIASMRDGEEGLSWRFKLVPFEWEYFGAQQSAANTCVVEMLDLPSHAQQCAAKRSKKLKDSQAILLDIVRTATAECGEFIKGDLNVPHNIRAVYRTTLKKYLKPRGYWDDDRSDAHNRGELSRDLKSLQAHKIIGVTSDVLWLIGKE